MQYILLYIFCQKIYGVNSLIRKGDIMQYILLYIFCQKIYQEFLPDFHPILCLGHFDLILTPFSYLKLNLLSNIHCSFILHQNHKNFNILSYLIMIFFYFQKPIGRYIINEFFPYFSPKKIRNELPYKEKEILCNEFFLPFQYKYITPYLRCLFITNFYPKKPIGGRILTIHLFAHF